MNARRAPSDGPEAGISVGRVLIVGAVVFAAAATGLLVLTDQQRWLRLGIVAALWAALTGAFLAARYRRQLSDQRESAAERQEVYELELEREIAARREHELTVEAEARRKAEEESRDDIAALRGELANLRQTLENLVSGEFLVERYALQAEATRMRALEGDRALGMRHDVKHLPAANVVPPVIREAETELIERVREVRPKPRREQPSARPEPRAGADSRPPSVPRQPERPPRPERPTPEPVKPAPAPRYEHPAEVSDRWFMPDGLADGVPPQPPRRSEQPRRQEPQRPADPPPTPTPAPRRPMSNWDTGEQEWGPSWEKKRPDPVRDSGAPIGGRAEQTSWLAQYNKPQDTPEPTYGSRAYVPQAARPEPPSQRNLEPASRHRIEEDDTGTGRRHRAEGQPSWQETVGRRSAESTGSHATGRSVNELLANHGLDSSPRRRRRRED